MALLVLVVMMSFKEPSFATADNVSNITRNFAPFGIMALGMTVVIITGGIDLSVGSIMGLVAIVAGLFLTWEYPWYIAFGMGMLAGAGVRRGQRLSSSPTWACSRSSSRWACWRSRGRSRWWLRRTKCCIKFGPDAPMVKAIGQFKWPLRESSGGWAPEWIPSCRASSG